MRIIENEIPKEILEKFYKVKFPNVPLIQALYVKRDKQENEQRERKKKKDKKRREQESFVESKLVLNEPKKRIKKKSIQKG